MKLHILGCNGPFPAAHGACSGYLIVQGEARVLMECGPGVLGRLMAVSDPAYLTGILLSHGHADHTSDLLALRYYLDIRRQGSSLAPLKVYVPWDDTSPVLNALKEAEAFEMHWIRPGDEVQLGSLSIQCGPARHPVPAVSFRMSGLAYTGDTNTCTEQKDFFQNAQVLLADGCLTQNMWRESAPHMGAVQAAMLAKDAFVERLVLTHLRPDVDEGTLLKEAAVLFPNTSLARAGDIIHVEGGA